MTDTIAYRVLTAADVAQLETGRFAGAPMDLADGFIHLSTASQLSATVALHFAGQLHLTIAAIDLAALGDRVSWEASRDGQLFPHLYGPLPRAAVIDQCKLEQDALGSVRLPPLRSDRLTQDILPRRRRVFVLGATGTIGRATVHALLRRGHEVVCLVRSRAGTAVGPSANDIEASLAGATVRYGEVRGMTREGIRGEHFDALVSCMASRNGAPADAWAVDHRANVDALAAARAAGVSHVVLLSAICVQKPLLAFQRAKLAFEHVLRESGVRYSIVRPTAFFKSLSGQVQRVKSGKPFLVFGDGTLTACKPISDEDLAEYLADCLHDETRWNRILPIGGPGDAITPRQQGECLFTLLGEAPRFRRVPVALLDLIIGVLGTLERAMPALAVKAELARIGRYYATESMLVLDQATGRYDAAATPSTGTETLFDYYASILGGAKAPERGDHAVF